MNILNIPDPLRLMRHFVVWNAEERKGRTTKVPYDAKSGRLASSTDKATWASAEEALSVFNAGSCSGIGFVFSEEAGIVGIDLDHCLNDDLQPNDFARNIVDSLDSYTEISPSGDGLHIFIRGELPGKGINKPAIEIYASGRFFTFTGNVFEGRDKVKAGGEFLANLYDQFKSETPPASKVVSIRNEPLQATPPNENILSRFLKDEYARALWEKYIPHKSQSEYDLAIASVAFHRGFEEQEAASLILWHRERWNENPAKALRADYIEDTLIRGQIGVSSTELELIEQEVEDYFVSAVDIVSTPKKICWLIKGYVPETGIIWLAGQWSTYKSFLALHEAFHISLGVPWCGNRTRKGKVVYIAGEGFGGFGKRIKALELSSGVKVSPDLLFTPQPIMLNTAPGFKRLVWKLKQEVVCPSVIFIDTKSANMEGSDSDAATMNQWISALREIQTQFNCAVIVVDHVGHMSKDRPRGVSQQMGAADAVYMVERHKQTEINIRIEKDPKDFNPPPAVALKADIVELPPEWNDEDGDLTTSLALVQVDYTPPPKATTTGLGKSAKMALEALMKMYSDYQANLDKAGSTNRPLVEFTHWRRECLDMGISPSTFNTIPGSLAKKGLIDTDDTFVYLTGAS